MFSDSSSVNHSRHHVYWLWRLFWARRVNRGRVIETTDNRASCFPWNKRFIDFNWPTSAHNDKSSVNRGSDSTAAADWETAQTYDIIGERTASKTAARCFDDLNWCSLYGVEGHSVAYSFPIVFVMCKCAYDRFVKYWMITSWFTPNLFVYFYLLLLISFRIFGFCCHTIPWWGSGESRNGEIQVKYHREPKESWMFFLRSQL